MEFTVALVCLIVLAAGIIQISAMGVKHSGLMEKAREEAGRKAMQEASPFGGAEFIQACTVGDDGIAYSKDDGKESGDVSLLSAGIIGYSHPTDLNRIRPDNAVSITAASAFPQLMFGLTEGEAEDHVDVIPIVRQLLYRRDTVDLKGKAWMTWTKGLY